MRSKTILVVEDDEMNMKLIKALFKIGDYKLIEASDAEEGIRLARENKPDLILMDIQLPGIDGLSATRIIKEDSALKDIKVVVLSSHAMIGDEEKANEAGCIGYLTKPINTRTFLSSLSQFI